MIQCHNCGEWTLDSEMIRKNMKVAGKAVLSYDVICPSCRQQIGKVLWGKYIQNIQHQQKVPVPPSRARGNSDRRQNERRQEERRQGERRRAIYIKPGLIFAPLDHYRGVERRKSDRRKSDRRKDDRRGGDRRQV